MKDHRRRKIKCVFASFFFDTFRLTASMLNNSLTYSTHQKCSLIGNFLVVLCNNSNIALMITLSFGLIRTAFIWLYYEDGNL